LLSGLDSIESPPLTLRFWALASKFIKKYSKHDKQAKMWFALGYNMKKIFHKANIKEMRLNGANDSMRVATLVELPGMTGKIGEFLNYLDIKEKWQDHSLHDYFGNTEAAEEIKNDWEEEQLDPYKRAKFQSDLLDQLLEDPFFVYKQHPRKSQVYSSLKSCVAEIDNGRCKHLTDEGFENKMDAVQRAGKFSNVLWQNIAETHPHLADRTTYCHHNEQITFYGLFEFDSEEAMYSRIRREKSPYKFF
jgi:hypothetical protein